MGVDIQPPLWYYNNRKGKVINMKEKLIKYWERKERQIEKYPEGGATFLGQAFGALEFAMEMLNDLDKLMGESK